MKIDDDRLFTKAMAFVLLYILFLAFTSPKWNKKQPTPTTVIVPTDKFNRPLVPLKPGTKYISSKVVQ